MKILKLFIYILIGGLLIFFEKLNILGVLGLSDRAKANIEPMLYMVIIFIWMVLISQIYKLFKRK